MKFSIIYMGDINAQNGVSKVIKSFLKNSSKFEEHGVYLSKIYSSRSNSENKIKKNDKRNKKTSINTRIKNILSKTMIGSIICIYIQYFMNANKAIKKYSIDNESSDIIMFHDIFSCYIFHKKKYGENKKTILVLHTNGDTWKMMYQYFPKIKKKFIINILNRIEDFTCRKSDKIIFVSKNSAEKFYFRKKDLKDKIQYIYNGLEKGIDILNIEDIENLKLISVGTLNSRKSQDLILKSLVELDDKSITLSLVGDGDKYSEFYEYARMNNILDQVKFYGGRDDVEELLKNHNVFIMSSKDEGLPISIIEAMKNGLAIIATNVGGISELIAGNGILVNPDVSSIKNAIATINYNKNDIKYMSKKSIEIFNSKFTIDKMIYEYCKILKELKYEK